MATWSLFTWSLLSVHSVIGLILRNLQDALVRVRQENAARQQTEATLRESERKIRNIFTGFALGKIFEIAFPTHLVVFPPALRTMFCAFVMANY